MATFDFQIVNRTNQPLKASGKWELIQYATRCQPVDSLAPPVVSKIKDLGVTAASIDIPAKGFANQSITLPVLRGSRPVCGDSRMRRPRPRSGRHLRTLGRFDAGKESVPNLRLRHSSAAPDAAVDHRRQGHAQEFGYFGLDDKHQWDNLDKNMKALMDADITLMMTVATGGNTSKMPLGKIR